MTPFIAEFLGTAIVIIIGNGVVLDPIIFKKEIEGLAHFNLDLRKNLEISKKASIILPTHRLLDAAYEKAKGDAKIGSTLKGIGPTYTDKISRQGLRVGDMISPNFPEKYTALVDRHKAILNVYKFEYDLAEAEKEFRARDQANIAWIKESFRVASEQNIETLVFAFQADVIRTMSRTGALAEKTGYHASIEQTLLPLARGFKGSILIVHGDSHTYEFDQAFLLDSQVLKNVFRLEVPGAKTTGAVNITIDEGRATPFSVKKIIVP